MDVDFGAVYRVEGQPGIAWRAIEYHKTRDEDYDWTGIENEDTLLVDCHMVGDDSVFTFDIDDLTALDEDEYCPECGQIGCTALKG